MSLVPYKLKSVTDIIVYGVDKALGLLLATIRSSIEQIEKFAGWVASYFKSKSTIEAELETQMKLKEKVQQDLAFFGQEVQRGNTAFREAYDETMAEFNHYQSKIRDLRTALSKK